MSSSSSGCSQVHWPRAKWAQLQNDVDVDNYDDDGDDYDVDSDDHHHMTTMIMMIITIVIMVIRLSTSTLDKSQVGATSMRFVWTSQASGKRWQRINYQSFCFQTLKSVSACESNTIESKNVIQNSRVTFSHRI